MTTPRRSKGGPEDTSGMTHCEIVQLCVEELASHFVQRVAVGTAEDVLRMRDALTTLQRYAKRAAADLDSRCISEP